MKGFFRRKIPGKNFGFIEGEDQRDYFVYWNDFSRQSIPFRNARDAGDPPDENSADKVEFEIEETPKGPRARKVRVLRNQQDEEGDESCLDSEKSSVESIRL